jgi:hypothetical protein
MQIRLKEECLIGKLNDFYWELEKKFQAGKIHNGLFTSLEQT